MADAGMPHFHNDPGVPEIRVNAHRFMCVGAKPPFDHPHIFMDMGDEHELVCSYCSTHYRFDPSLKPGTAEPAQCLLADADLAHGVRAA